MCILHRELTVPQAVYCTCIDLFTGPSIFTASECSIRCNYCWVSKIHQKFNWNSWIGIQYVIQCVHRIINILSMFKLIHFHRESKPENSKSSTISGDSHKSKCIHRYMDWRYQTLYQWIMIKVFTRMLQAVREFGRNQGGTRKKSWNFCFKNCWKPEPLKKIPLLLLHWSAINI